MKQSDVTQLFAVPWASQADSSTIASIPTTATAIGRASMALGFPKTTMTPIAAGGVPPYGEDMNGILSMLSVAARASEAGLLRPFSASFANAIGGYPAGATVAHPSVPGRFLVCTMDNNSNDPSQNMGGWTDPLAAFQPAGNYASPSDLGKYLPLTGGTLSGSLHANGSEGSFGNTLFGGKLSAGIDGHSENSYLQTQIANGNPLTIVGQQGAPGGDWHNWVFDPSDGSITSPNGNKFVQQSSVDAERNRAEAAEAGLLPLTGGTLTGDLTLTGNTWQNNLYGRTLHSKADNSQIDAALQLVGTRDNPVLSLRTVNESGGWQQWSFNSATGNVVSPGGGVLPEVLGMSGRVVIQNFIATVSAEQGTINFPNAFKPGTSPFVICVATTEPGTNFRGMTAVRQDANRNLQITNIGFDYFIYNGTNTSRSVPVLAIGIM